MKKDKFTNDDYELLKLLAKLTPDGLKTAMESFLLEKYEKVINNSEFIYAIGDLPVVLIAHLDTVFMQPPQEIYFDREQGVIWSPDGLGADDRAGVFAIIKLIKDRTKKLPSIILTMGEEKGGIGASEVIKKYPKPLSQLKYAIELDRQGFDDCVFYNCDNADFTKYIEKFGFHTQIGSFTDISFICPFWGIAGVNLSVGYYEEHSFSERLFVGAISNTIYKVHNMLAKIDEAPFFEYIEKQYKFLNGKFINESLTDFCCNCGKELPYVDFIYTSNENELLDELPYCPECAEKKLTWCEICGYPFEKEKAKGSEYGCVWCPECFEVLTSGE